MLNFTAIMADSALESRFRALRGGFTDKPTDPADIKSLVFMIVVPIGLVLILALLLHVRARKKLGGASTAHPMRLFNALLKKMGMPFADRFVLRALARSSKLPHPAILLFERELFDRHTQRWLGALTPRALNTYVSMRLTLISETAFSPAPSEAPS
ncbi:MAG TPA: hypothetical protein VNT79_13140 [Phycisphaerae bacterium]|nr:hypothetical protein [Phycisphaerae bacterium]